MSGLGVPQIPLTLSEAEFQPVVTDYASLMRWTWCHFFPLQNKRGKYQTPVEGYPGMPDLVLARGGVVLLVELKRQTGSKISPAQKSWLEALGENGRIWYPSHWNSGEIPRTLRHLGRPVLAR